MEKSYTKWGRAGDGVLGADMIFIPIDSLSDSPGMSGRRFSIYS